MTHSHGLTLFVLFLHHTHLHQWLVDAPTALDPNTIVISCVADKKEISSVHNLGYTIYHSEYIMRSILKQSWDWDTSGYVEVLCCFEGEAWHASSFFSDEHVCWLGCDSSAIDNYLAPVMLQAKKAAGSKKK